MAICRYSRDNTKNRWANGNSLVIMLILAGTSQEVPTSTQLCGGNISQLQDGGWREKGLLPKLFIKAKGHT